MLEQEPSLTSIKQVKNVQDRKTSASQISNSCSLHSSSPGQFFCLIDHCYLCEDCYEQHDHHHEFTDSVKNLLTDQFNEWRALMDHAQNVTKQRIHDNKEKQKDFLLYLKAKSDSHPDIDEETLKLILAQWVKKLQPKINEIKENCKRNDLEGALTMRKELKLFSTQLQELEQRSTITSMCSRYLKITTHHDDLEIYKGLDPEQQFFLLRKQYDSRMKQLSNVMLGQHHKMVKLENLI
mmetsp:Transcript_24948/g.38754  ORF Transcript_24948/g.38754 Transcript_24948/m.38754 type:complete len:238 (+) Transcript_24948:1905-2618(+)|eukprot:CAMPEP_0170500200 /NCGR_PEP_ID=MMETSP0208-20121228/34063_1 /TAXON_ID=197538 /ORGANISM="Strombidium inclinatum, Strain S3" /LENGTH=237 /DNA_ID=CAMNT_0010778115 /DNA_START=1835 /DNA_END=2548 /DNA_ORIENTATION=-